MPFITEMRRDRYLVSTDQSRLQPDAIHEFLATSYWSPGVPSEVVRTALANSLCLGLYFDDRQIGLARVVTDYATFAYLCDVYVLDAHRGHGLGHWLMECVMAHPGLQNLRRMMLATRDAHGLYEKFGFASVKAPQRMMERHDPDVYQRVHEVREEVAS